MNTRKGVLLVICAPSGTGKSTLIRQLRQRHPDLKFSISCTTRPPRRGERDGIDYFFVSEEEFFKRRQENYFAEWAEVHNNYYGTPLGHVREQHARGQDIVFDIDVQGALQLQKSLPQAAFVFIFPPSLHELERRLRGRGTESETSLEKRLTNAAQEIEKAGLFEYQIVNDNLEQAATLLEAVYLTQTVKNGIAPEMRQELLAQLQNRTK